MKLAYLIGYVVDDGFAQFRIYRQRKALLGGSFCYREVSSFVFQIGIRWLEMNRHGVMYAGGDTALRQANLQFVAPRRVDHIEVPDRTAIARFMRSQHSGISKKRGGVRMRRR